MAGVDILAQAFSGANAQFLGEQYARWAVNPNSVDPSFADLFGAMDDEARAVLADAAGCPRESKRRATGVSPWRASVYHQSVTTGLNARAVEGRVSRAKARPVPRAGVEPGDAGP